jgi:hypothetical protein
MPCNLPPNKCMKEGVLFLALIVLGPKDPVTKINVFMQPLIEELKVLWQGVEAYDSHLKHSFTLRVAYLWSIHDLLAHGIFSGWCVHGRLRCLICMGDSQAYRLKHDKKETFFDVHRRLLPSNHPFRNDTKSFQKGKRVRDGPLKRQTGEDIMRQHRDLKSIAGGGFEGYSEQHNWTHISFLWELPYMKALLLPHNIDLMH